MLGSVSYLVQAAARHQHLDPRSTSGTTWPGGGMKCSTDVSRKTRSLMADQLRCEELTGSMPVEQTQVALLVANAFLPALGGVGRNLPAQHPPEW